MRKISIACICALTLSLLTTGCGDKEMTPPVAGEYGETLVDSRELTEKEIYGINNPQEIMHYNIDFEANPSDNPFRFLVVVRGTAESDGKVDLSFYNHQKTKKGKTMEQVMHQEDTRIYQKNDKVLLVLDSEPFSLDVTTGDIEREVMIESYINKNNNFIAESAELQVWKGQGEKSSRFFYPFLILMLIGMVGFGVRFMKWKLR